MLADILHLESSPHPVTCMTPCSFRPGQAQMCHLALDKPRCVISPTHAHLLQATLSVLGSHAWQSVESSSTTHPTPLPSSP